MKRQSLLLGAMFLVLILAGLFLLDVMNSSAKALTMEEARKLVEDRYHGSVVQLTLEEGVYLIELKKDQGLYEIKLHPVAGDILHFSEKERLIEKSVETSLIELSETDIRAILNKETEGELVFLEKEEVNKRPVYKGVLKDPHKETEIILDAVTGEVLSKSKKEITITPKRLTQEEAAGIAKKQVNGLIDEIKLVMKNGESYYFVEIETTHGQEAILQIHAITGKVLSITWDDHGGKEKDDDKRARDREEVDDD